MQVAENQVGVFVKDNATLQNGNALLSEYFSQNAGKLSLYNKEEIIFNIGQVSKELYFVVSGRVKIGTRTEDGKEVLKAILSEGDVFGEMVFIEEKVRKDFALAMDAHTVVRVLQMSEVNEMIHANSDLNKSIFKILGQRIRKAESRLSSLMLKDARTRVVDFIKDLAEEQGQKVGFETVIRNYMTHKDIASLTGTSRQTVTTTLNSLRDNNIINFDRRRILIRDLDLLV